MPDIFFDALPPRTTRSTIVRLLVQVGGIDRSKIGKIHVDGRKATASVPERWAGRLATLLDGSSLGSQNIRCWTEMQAASGDEENFFRRQIRLLELEAKAEADRALQSLAKLSPSAAERTGNSLCNLTIRERTGGLGGRAILTLGPKNQDIHLPWTRLDAGAPVLLSPQRGGKGSRGVVARRTPSAIEAAFDRWPDEEEEGPFRLDISHDEISRQRQRRALERAETAEGNRLAELRRVLLGESEPSFETQQQVSAAERLNESQHEAVEFARAARDVAIIHGPPGTGKTTTVVELIRRTVSQEQTVLACAPSNMGVDNLVEKLLDSGVDVVRIGHPARVLPQLRNQTLDLLVQSHPDMQLVKKLRRDARQLFDKSDRFTRAKPAPGSKRQMRDEAKEMLADAKRIEHQIVRSILDSHSVICATLTSLDSELLGQRRFDLAVIDEACQSVEPGCWIPILRSERIVLAGDHCQLPPTVLSHRATEEGFQVSMLERLVDLYGPSVTRLLDTQYRMHENIMAFSSNQFYDGELRSPSDVAEQSLLDLPGVDANSWTDGAVLFIDTAGWTADEQPEPDGDSRLNPGEADLVTKAVDGLLASGVAEGDIAVITPYSAQVRLLQDRFRERLSLEIDTVDGFQGREKEVVVVSLVRSNARGEIGFLKDTRRMNVAWTRARRKVIVIGDSATVGSHPFYAAMLEHVESVEGYRSVWEFV